jgi:hypothetical protein
MSQTWNITGAGTVTGIKYNVTDTLSSAASLLMDLQVGGTSQFSVSKAGLITALGQVTSTNGVLNLGSSNVAISSATSRAAATAGRSLLIRSNLATVADDGVYIAGNTNLNIATGTQTGVTVNDTIAYASGTGSYNAISVPTTISSSAAASGSIVRGLYIAPTFTTTGSDYRAIEVTNGSVAFPYTAQSATYAIKNNDYTINCTANTFTATLPTAVGCTGRIYTIVNSGAGTITIGTTSSQTFANVTATPTTLTMATVGTRVVQSNGANWLLISSL